MKKHVGWKIPNTVEDNWQEINIEYLRFVFDQAEKRLSETVKTSDNISSKGYRIVGITVTLLTVISTYLLRQNLNDQEEVIAERSALIAVVIVTVSLFLSVRSIWRYNLEVPGSEPSKTLLDFRVSDYEGENQYKSYLLNEIVAYQDRMTHNFLLNKRRMSYVDYAILLLIALPIGLSAYLAYQMWLGR